MKIYLLFLMSISFLLHAGTSSAIMVFSIEFFGNQAINMQPLYGQVNDKKRTDVTLNPCPLASSPYRTVLRFALSAGEPANTISINIPPAGKKDIDLTFTPSIFPLKNEASPQDVEITQVIGCVPFTFTVLNPKGVD